MTAEAYLGEFAHLLRDLTDTEADDILEYYREYILDAGLDDYAAIVQKLGTPQQLARKTLADYTIQHTDTTTATPGHNAHLIWLITLALFAAPIGVPVALALLAIGGAALITLAAVVFALVVTVAGLFFTGGLLLIAGIAVLSQSLATAAFYIGCGLVGLSVGYLGLLLSYLLVKLLLRWGVSLVKALYRRFSRQRLQGVNNQ